MAQLALAWSIAKETAQQWSEDKAARLGAALAYYTVFSIGPLLFVVIAVAGLVFGQDAVRGEVTAALETLLGDAGAKGVDAMLAEASKPQSGAWAVFVGLATLVLGATGVVVQLKDALNTIWGVEPPKGRGVWGFVRTYVLSLAGVLSLAFLLLISLVLSAAVSAFAGLFANEIGEQLMHAANFAVSFVLVTLLFALMFKWLPDANVAWKDAWIGATVTAVLFTAGRFAIGMYLGGQSMETTFGAAASLAVLLVWVYYSAQIVFLGAEFTEVYARRTGAPEQERGKAFAADAQPSRLVAPSSSRLALIGSLIAIGLAWYRHRRERNASA